MLLGQRLERGVQRRVVLRVDGVVDDVPGPGHRRPAHHHCFLLGGRHRPRGHRQGARESGAGHESHHAVLLAPTTGAHVDYADSGRVDWMCASLRGRCPIRQRGAVRLDEADGGWQSEYNTMSRQQAIAAGALTISGGSGTAPTLMGFGNDPDKLAIISDGDSNGAQLVAFWRDKIPVDFTQKPGTKSSRIADQIRTDISKVTIERLLRCGLRRGRAQRCLPEGGAGHLGERVHIRRIAPGPIRHPEVHWEHRGLTRSRRPGSAMRSTTRMSWSRSSRRPAQ